MEWTGRVVTDTRAVVLSEHLTAAVSLAPGDDRDEALAGAWWRCGDEGEGWIADEADVEIAAEYLYAAAYEN